MLSTTTYDDQTSPLRRRQGAEGDSSPLATWSRAAWEPSPFRHLQGAGDGATGATFHQPKGTIQLSNMVVSAWKIHDSFTKKVDLTRENGCLTSQLYRMYRMYRHVTTKYKVNGHFRNLN